MDEIIKIVYERNKERRLLLVDDIKRICHIILKKNHYNFVKNVEVFPYNPKDSNCAGVYYAENIFFFYKEIIDLIQNNFENFSSTYQTEGADVDTYNYLCLNIIFHEIAHVRQYAIKNSKHYSLEKKLFSLFLELSKNSDFYNENYQDIVTEVNADNVAMITTNYIYSKLPKNFLTKNDWQIYQSFLLKNMLYDNYEIIAKQDEVISPYERVVGKFDEEIFFYLDTNLTECINLMDKASNFTMYKKLMLGLPITYLEYAYCSLAGDRININEKNNLVKTLQKKL